MQNLKIETEETISYWRRIRSTLIIYSIIPFMLLVFAIALHSVFGFLILLLPATLIFILPYVRVDECVKDFITLFQIEDGILIIEYNERKRKGRIKMKLEDFTFILKSPDIGSRTPIGYPDFMLKIEYKGTRLLIQARDWGWEKSFDILTEYLKQNQLLQKEFLFWRTKVK